MSTKDKIMDIAERYIRTRGFNSFSFRDIADEIGIKSASVHYHFTAKEDLGEAVTLRYTDAALAYLNGDDGSARDLKSGAERFVQLFRNALTRDERMCLCGMLGAEIDSLADSIKTAVQTFFSRLEQWLTQFLQSHHPEQGDHMVRARARSAIAALEGAMIMARTMGDVQIFEDVAGRIEQGLSR